MKFFGFRGGVHPPENKIQTEHLPIEKLESPNEIFVPLLQHIGAPLNPIVNVGDRVLKGQKIADAEGLAVPVHAPVSGTVTKIENRVYPLSGKVMTIFIENDKKEEWAELTKIANWETADKKELLDIIREKGIVGIGGATFPTHVKLNPPPNTKLDSLILNGAECEPYLNSDNRLMLENPKSIVEGIKIIKKILNVPNVYVGIEDNKPEAIELALKGTEDLTDLDDGDTYIGFPVDSGLATIVDAQTIEIYNKFYEQWHINYPEKNIYDDYYSDLFQLNAMAYPQYQRSKGDWINFTIPETELTVPMIQSGFGDGLYPVYWAFDKDGQICQLIMEYIDCSEAYQ